MLINPLFGGRDPFLQRRSSSIKQHPRHLAIGKPSKRSESLEDHDSDSCAIIEAGGRPPNTVKAIKVWVIELNILEGFPTVESRLGIG